MTRVRSQRHSKKRKKRKLVKLYLKVETLLRIRSDPLSGFFLSVGSPLIPFLNKNFFVLLLILLLSFFDLWNLNYISFLRSYFGNKCS